jgi:GT2 family glycosyltransferase
VGGFDKSLITGEDPELCERLRRAGYRLFETRRLLVAHLDNAKTPLAFYKKEVWRGLGMFGTARVTKFDRPVIMTLCHLTSLVLAGFVLLMVNAPLIARVLGATMLINAVPLITVLYRRRSASMTSSALKAICLYHLYYLARIEAMARALGRINSGHI